MRPWFCSCGDPRRLASFHNISRFMIPANHDSRIEAQQLPRERFSPLADSVGKLLFRSYSKSSRAAEASLLLGRGEPCNLLLRATRTVLTSAATIRRVNCREQRTLTRIRSMCILEFFNGIDRSRPVQARSNPPSDQISVATRDHLFLSRSACRCRA